MVIKCIHLLWPELSCPYPQFACWNPQCDNIRRWAFVWCLCKESETLMSGISAFIKDPRAVPCPFHHVGSQWQVWDPKRAFMLACYHPYLILSMPRTIRNKFLCFANYLVCNIVLEQQKRTSADYIAILTGPWNTITALLGTPSFAKWFFLPMYIPTSNVWEFCCSISSPLNGIISFFFFWPYSRCTMAS